MFILAHLNIYIRSNIYKKVLSKSKDETNLKFNSNKAFKFSRFFSNFANPKFCTKQLIIKQNLLIAEYIKPSMRAHF